MIKEEGYSNQWAYGSFRPAIRLKELFDKNMGKGLGSGEGWGEGEGEGGCGHGSGQGDWNHGICGSCSPCGDCKYND